MASLPAIELRKVSHSKSLSEETPAYTAQVWFNGVHICDVSNHGHGGCDMQYPAKGKTRADVDALNSLIKSTHPKQSYTANGEDHFFDTDLELLCHLMLDRIEIEKTVKRAAALIAKLRERGDKVLNELTLADAVAVYERMGG